MVDGKDGGMGEHSPDLDLLLTFSICRSVCLLTLHMCTNTNTAAVTNTAKEALIRANFRCVCRAVKS